MAHETKATRVLKNTARGNRTVYEARVSIFRAISEDGAGSISALGRHLTEKLFRVPREGWVPLQFLSQDWHNLRSLKEPSEAQEKGYLSLLMAYVSCNSARVNAVYERLGDISAAVLSGDGQRLGDLKFKWDRVDQISMFHNRLYAAEHAHSSREMADQFRITMQSTWMRARFMYAFLGFCINNVVDSALDTFLSFVLNESYDEIERDVVKTIMRDEVQYAETFAFKAYLGLMMHPYDACELLLNHAENSFVETGSAPPALLDALEQLEAVIFTPRLTDLLNLMRRKPLAFSDTPTGAGLRSRFQLDGEALRALISFVNLESSAPQDVPEYLQEANRMRSQRYPEPVDFDLAVTTFGRWRFLDAGRLLTSLIVCLYMLPRREMAYERKCALRLACYYGEVLPYFIAAPEGEALTRLLEVDVPTDVVASQLENPDRFDDRRWLIGVQWALRTPQAEVQLTQWLHLVRKLLPIKPAYLTGIRWSWFDDLIATRRLRTLRGNADACYALLLRQIEERTVDAWLRIAMEPLAEGKSLDEFLEWLMDEYADKAIGFVRYFLTPENILLLGLAPNETAALIGRVSGLRACVRRFGFSELMTERQYDEESKALTAAILFKDVSGSQFEVAWEIFHRDVLELELESFGTLRALTDRVDERPLLGNAKIEAPHIFKNGKTASYEFENREWPLAQVLLGIIDAFMKHPSVGIEVLLSTRFRHDTMRREYEGAFLEAKTSIIPGVFQEDTSAIVEALMLPLLDVVSAWLNRRMQTQRPGKEDALFDFVPHQAQLAEMIVACADLNDFNDVIDVVVSQLKLTSSEQVRTARENFDTELRSELSDEIARGRSKVTAESNFREEDVRKVAATLATIATQKTDELLSWFSTTSPNRGSMSIQQLKVAADGLFELAVARGALRTYCAISDDLQAKYPPDQARLIFDLLTEAFANAMKYGKVGRVQVRIASRRVGEQAWLRVSSSSELGEIREWSVLGERYLSASDTIFGEGSSGLGKIAALSATLSQQPTTVFAYRRQTSFHLYVPLPVQR